MKRFGTWLRADRKRFSVLGIGLIAVNMIAVFVIGGDAGGLLGIFAGIAMLLLVLSYALGSTR